ncbi:GGDEF domain-containing protein [Botrimarina mediterranea]|uniref:GGDEF domain-containing protein n=1 Tax=Botrimarina mediterranea TaxID=2528022 RepID=UPI00118A20BE|nr:Response regulator PleD [Planctomycetes bacterium K2D]
MTTTVAATRDDLWRRFAELIQRHPKKSIAISLVLATIVAIFDYATGDEVPILFCYLPSVMLICWVSNLAMGATLAAVCCTGWLIDDLIGLEEGGVTAHECWTAASHAMCFAVVIVMLRRLKVGYANERRLARTDALTGLLNAKAFRERAEEEIARVNRYGHQVSAAYIDCDNFKTVNDTLGHQEGDRLLAAIAQEMKVAVRETDVPARMGGDEFAILLPETSQQDAHNVVNRLQAALNDRMQQEKWPVTFSIGVAIYTSPPASVDALLHSADKLMYEVKAGSKNDFVLRLVA